jgi:hypothetical protein
MSSTGDDSTSSAIWTRRQISQHSSHRCRIGRGRYPDRRVRTDATVVDTTWRYVNE